MMIGNLRHKPPTRRDQADHIRLKAAGEPAHINAGEARLLARLMPEAAGPVVTRGLLAEAGIKGDDRVTNLTPAEAAVLKRRGGAGTRNPATGMLQYNDSDNDGMSGGEGNDSVGSSEGTGPGVGGDTMGGGSDNGTSMGLGYRSYDPATMPGIESLLDTPNGYRAQGYEGLSMRQYSQPDTFGRLLDTYLYGPPPSYRALGQVPGRYGAPTGRGPGAVGTMAANFGGPMMSGLMSLGMHMDQAMSPETRAASMAANEAQGTKNSTGRDAQAPAALEAQASGTQYAGTASGAQAAQQPQVPPGYTMNPAGQIIPLPDSSGSNDRPAYQTPIRNLLLDYVLRGRRGGGLLG